MPDKVADQHFEGEAPRLVFFCPGCECAHWVRVEGSIPPVWLWNEDREFPTFSPSVKTWWPTPEGMHVCHSYVQGGRMRFLGDCTHKLKGQTVEIPEWEKAYEL